MSPSLKKKNSPILNNTGKKEVEMKNLVHISITKKTDGTITLGMNSAISYTHNPFHSVFLSL